VPGNQGHRHLPQFDFDQCNKAGKQENDESNRAETADAGIAHDL